MADGKSSLRIDWFDGTLIEESRLNANTSAFADEDQPEPTPPEKPQQIEKKPIGFKRLHEISLMEPPGLTLEVAHRPGFWNLLDEAELKGDFIVLIVKILAKVYKSLEPGERSKIATQLKTRFQNSNFLVILKKYVNGLPSVRVVEKKLNFQLWDDVEAFFFQIVNLCEEIINFGGNSEEFLQYINDLLEITETSAIGVCKEHMEVFNDELFDKIREIRSRIPRFLHREQSNNPDILMESKDPNSFKNLNIFPTRDDLLGSSEVNIKPNIINGAYPNVEHYLDIQFKLLREDCFGPLREGICKYMTNPTKRRHENIRVHPKVRILRTYVTNNKVGHLVDIAWKERINGTVDSKRLAYNKQLMFGSLVLFTSDNFETILCATVLDSNLNLLSEGYIAVSFQNPVSQKIFSESYIMVESEVFFEPYHRVLKVLQNSRLDDLPMKKYIVDVQTDTQPPAYLNSETIYTITDPKQKEEIPIPVLDTNQWPTYALDLDDSQMEAYKFALTREFAVIQGPPGTGKTFLGVKIATTLLKNLSLEGTPMLIICYTNHALDQFLEGLLDVTTNIIRLGSQSKSNLLEPYSLHNARMKIKSKYSYLYANKRAELEKIYKQMIEVQSEIEKCEKEIISYKSLKPYLKVGGRNLELKTCKEDSVLSWLFSHLEGKEEFIEEAEDWESLDDDVTEDIETCFSEQWALKEIDSMQNSIKYLKEVTEENIDQKMTDKFETQINKIRSRLMCFKRYKALYQNENRNEGKVEKIQDLYNLTPEQRWRVYYTAVDGIKNELTDKMNILLEQHNTTSRELEEVTTLTDSEVMRTARVVGVTTTTAARRHDLMRSLHQSIVIVEEAAEVLEAHVVASLTHHCQHLILIGDHKQLRPTAAHYKLAKHYNLEISLFERMIRNGVHARALTIQRRMRPKYVQLLVPIVYDRLDSHTSVHGYPDVRGIVQDLYFYEHDVMEDCEGLEDSWSHKNTFEAKWCVALANYLRRMEYKPEEVTILSMYTGQVSLIKEVRKERLIVT
ncbi:hypothetical protein O3G_MSEX001366 [Manduca sexta]|uniref:NFX1-type zinc finger-containing protein 1 n=1 Tax=Manduca sexta TaxID=7130 RepID=A0A921YK57_MANSE|nr:hypothetical protein O3G_MSEX001366 [Manduca sexta]